jgi:uncharacterized protein (TIGR04255 family)
MTINEVFPYPTVKKVIFQIRFPNLFYIENKIGDLQMKIMKEFPESSLLHRQRILFADFGPDIKIEKDSSDKPDESAARIWRFQSPNNYQLNVLSDSLDISSDFHKTYNNPKSEIKFRDTIEVALNSFFEVTQIPIIKRIGLRYIDECPIPSKNSKKFKEYYKTTFPLGRFKLEDAREMQFQTVVARGKNFLRFIEKFTKVDGEYKLILDFDGFSENIDPSDCLSVADNLHDLITNEYKKSLKEPVFEYMRTGGLPE